jgi:carboxynorspermidine decarboxylase
MQEYWVLDIVKNKAEIAIMDTSAETHMPDVLLMPYRPRILESGRKNEKKYGYRFAGPSCLAGDIIGDYSFDRPLTRGAKLVFTDMALYSIVKNKAQDILMPRLLLRRLSDHVVVLSNGIGSIMVEACAYAVSLRGNPQKLMGVAAISVHNENC